MNLNVWANAYRGTFCYFVSRISIFVLNPLSIGPAFGISIRAEINFVWYGTWILKVGNIFSRGGGVQPPEAKFYPRHFAVAVVYRRCFCLIPSFCKENCRCFWISVPLGSVLDQWRFDTVPDPRSVPLDYRFGSCSVLHWSSICQQNYVFCILLTVGGYIYISRQRQKVNKKETSPAPNQ